MIISVTSVMFVTTGFVASFKSAFNILTGTVSPFGSRAGFAGVCLAVIGYLVVPAMVGTTVAVVFERQRRARTLTEADLEEAVGKVLAKHFPPLGPPDGRT